VTLNKLNQKRDILTL